MGTPLTFTGSGILLVGNSIVDGGLWVDQNQRLAAQIGARSRRPVWPIAAGSWSVLNELAYLRRRPDIVRRVDQVVLVISSPDVPG